MNLQAPSIQVSAKTTDQDNAVKPSASDKGTQDTEFNLLFSSSITQVVAQAEVDPTSGDACSAAGCFAATGQKLPHSSTDLPFEDGLEAFGLVAVLPENSLKQPDAISVGTPPEQIVSIKGLAGSQLNTLANLAVSGQAAASTDTQVHNTLLTTQNGINASAGSPLVAGAPINPSLLAEAAIPVSAVTTEVKQTASVTSQQAVGSLVSQEGILAQQGQGSGTRQNLDNFTQQDYFLADLQSSKSDIKMDFSQLLDKTPGLVSKELPMLDSVMSANKLSAGVQKAPTETLQLYQHINKPEWSQEFGSRMVLLNKEGVQSAQLRLTPAHLGAIDIKISIEQDQAKISFLSQHSAVRDVIEASLPKLRDMMQEAGVKLEQVNVSAQSSNPENRQQSQLQRDQQERQSSTQQLAHDETEQMAQESGRVIEVSLSGVDYYA